MNRHILVRFPSRGRPGDFIERLTQLHDRAVDNDRFDVLAILDNDDPELHRYHEALRDTGLQCMISYGTSKSKVDAINRPSFIMADMDLMVVMSDDMEPMRGWDQMIRSMAEDKKDIFLWFSDGCQDRICTIPCMDSAYYKRTGYVYHPAYKSVRCDDEQTIVAKASGRMIKSDMILFGHHHNRHDKSVKQDRLYHRNYAMAAGDLNTFNSRKKLGFPS